MKRIATLIGLVGGLLVILSLPAFAPCHSVQFSPAEYTIGEGAGKVTLTVTNGGGLQQKDMMVDYATANGTARAPMDYTSKSGTVTWTVGASADVTLDVPIRNDTVDEPAERFTVNLSNVRPPASCEPPPNIDGGTATVTITDNDRPRIIPKPSASQSQAPASSPSASPRQTSLSPTPTRTRSPSPSPTLSLSPSPTITAIASGNEAGGGLSGGALAGIVAGVIVLGGGAALYVRRRFLS